MSEKTEPKKKESLDERLVKLHPKFLETIKEVYPLAVLGSLCIAIAAFTTQTYPDAQPYAITAASLFLIAFVVSFLFKITPNYYLALISYISTALAIVFLFLVVSVFIGTIPMVGKSVGVIPETTSAFALLMLGYFFYRFRKRTKSNIIRLCCTIGIPLTLLIISYYVVDTLARFIGFSLPDFMSLVIFSLMAVLATISITMILVTEYNRKKKKKT